MQDYRDRNRLWQTTHLQNQIDSASVVIGGMGGLGWAIGAALIGLGVRNFSIFDPDPLEIVNINRLWGCHRKHVGQPKVDVFSEIAHEVDQNISITTYKQNVPSEDFERELQKADIVFGGYDLPEPRLATQLLALKNKAVYIDTGTAVQPHSDQSFSGFGQIFISTTLSDTCIVCAGLRMDSIGYRGEGMVPLPSSGIINSVLANLAVSTWMKILLGEPVASLLRFDWNSFTLTTAADTPKRVDCPICGSNPAWKKSLD